MEHRPSDRVHVPVLSREIADELAKLEGELARGVVLDGTVGAGGHAAAILERMPEIRLVGADQDPDPLALAASALAPFGDRARLVHLRHSELAEWLDAEGLERPVAMLFDLGVCSMHLDRSERGFSFQEDGPLDMRMDPRRERTAADVVNRWDEDDLADLLYYEGGETRSRAIARAICEARRRAPFLRTAGLAELVARAADARSGRIHPATRTFQALRRAVNEEAEELASALDLADARLADGGLLFVVSFHSGDDRRVKHHLVEGERAGRWDLASRKPIAPAHAEVRANRRARSARLRIARRTRAEGAGA